MQSVKAWTALPEPRCNKCKAIHVKIEKGEYAEIGRASKYRKALDMVWSCARGCLDWISGKGSSRRGRSGTGTGSPGNWSQHQIQQFLRSVYTMVMGQMLWLLGWACAGPAVGLDDLCGSLPTPHTLSLWSPQGGMQHTVPANSKRWSTAPLHLYRACLYRVI